MTHQQQRELQALDQAYRTVGLDKAGTARRNRLKQLQNEEVSSLAAQLQRSRLTRNATTSPTS